MRIEIEVTKEALAKPVIPVGETYEDTRRLAALNERLNLIDFLLIDVRKTAEGKNRVEHSIKTAGQLADAFLNKLTAYD